MNTLRLERACSWPTNSANSCGRRFASAASASRLAPVTKRFASVMICSLWGGSRGESSAGEARVRRLYGNQATGTEGLAGAVLWVQRLFWLAPRRLGQKTWGVGRKPHACLACLAIPPALARAARWVRPGGVL